MAREAGMPLTLQAGKAETLQLLRDSLLEAGNTAHGAAEAETIADDLQYVYPEDAAQPLAAYLIAGSQEHTAANPQTHHQQSLATILERVCGVHIDDVVANVYRNQDK
jgi:hypothetical protein